MRLSAESFEITKIYKLVRHFVC